jgi:hypothetical protein
VRDDVQERVPGVGRVALGQEVDEHRHEPRRRVELGRRADGVEPRAEPRRVEREEAVELA